MSKLVWKSLLVSPAVLGLALATSASAASQQPEQLEIANTQVTNVESLELDASTTTEVTETETLANEVEPELNFEAPETTSIAQSEADSREIIDQINDYSGSQNSLEQVTSVSDLTDIDAFWFEAVEKMVDKYGCIVGYPDRTFRGQRNITRYEFAAAVSRCMEYWEERLVGDGDIEGVATLRRIVNDLRDEIALLQGRVDDLDGRVSFLEDNQFSTTTKLSGEVIFAVTDEFLFNTDSETVFQDRGRLTLSSSFTGQDSLYTRLTFGTTDPGNFPIGTGGETVQTQDIFSTTNNNVVVDWLAYYTPLPLFGENNASQLYVAAWGGIWSDIVPTLNPYFSDFDGGNGALSSFASESPIYRIGGNTGAAISLGVGLLESILGPSTLTLGYLAGGGNDPTQGLFNDDYAALAQLNFNLGDRIAIGGTYVHGYHPDNGAIFDLGEDTAKVGSTAANFPHNGITTGAAVTNSYGIEAAFRLSDNISISGFGMYSDVILLGAGDSEIWSYGAGVAFADLGKEGNVLGIFGGAQPYAFQRTVNGAIQGSGGQDIPWTVEAFYKYQLNDNISITPGVIWLANPGQGFTDDDALIGTLRTTFTF